jgi:uncharacterized protein
MNQNDIYKLHKKYAKSEINLEIGWNHSEIVKSISLQIANSLKNKFGIEVDKKMIEIGALVHDIGFYEYFDKDGKKSGGRYIDHGKTGYEILLKEDFSRPVARFALCHVGVGLEKDIPITLEEEIVCYADNFHSKGHPGFNDFDQSFKEMVEINPDFGVILNRFKDKFGVPDLTELREKYKKWHEEINR